MMDYFICAKSVSVIYQKRATVISKHEKTCEARELYIAFECFDILGKHERKFLISLLIRIDYSSAQEPTYINAQRNDKCK